jgi:hypothetical protein
MEIAEENFVSSLVSRPCPAIPVRHVAFSALIDWAKNPR